MIKMKWSIWVCLLLYCPHSTQVTTATESDTTQYVSTDEEYTEAMTTESSSECDGMYEPLDPDGGCGETYLYTSNNCCLSQDWLIGLSAGIGGFVILCLVIALIVVCVQLKDNKKAVKKRDEALMLQNNAYGNSFDGVVLPSAAKANETAPKPTAVVEDKASIHSTNETKKNSETDKTPEVPVEVVVEAAVVASSAPREYETPARIVGGGYEDQFHNYQDLHPSRDNSVLRPKEDPTRRREEPAPYYGDRNRYSEQRPTDDPYQRYSRDPSRSYDRYTPRDPTPYGDRYDVGRSSEQERDQVNRNKSLREETKPFNYLNATSRDRVSKGMDYAENRDMYGRDGRNDGYANAGYLKDEPVNMDPDYKDFTPSLGNIDTTTEYKIRRPSVPDSPSNQSGRKY